MPQTAFQLGSHKNSSVRQTVSLGFLQGVPGSVPPYSAEHGYRLSAVTLARRHACFQCAACHALCLLQCDRSLSFPKAQERWSMMLNASLQFLYKLCSSSLEHARATDAKAASPCSSNSTYLLQLPTVLPKIAFTQLSHSVISNPWETWWGPICNTASVGKHDSSQRSLERRDTGNAKSLCAWAALETTSASWAGVSMGSKNKLEHLGSMQQLIWLNYFGGISQMACYKWSSQVM